ncbi:hypothetical protein CLNEO_05180 [Anaerotignum neopropionicum]|uniref:Uncharacterized protein n=1 Tax=Anaerotignum neopropionicum TaxID=36847 RepID=A0A136WIP1_9FIRM|nr:hypothetical protein [Anaerotignum neopropionicum]KXL54412.1 hypothetical protein CLNEO_05180 [Anaerotignum neopropionicum]
MNLEESIKSITEQKLSDGTIEKIISEQFEKGVNTAVSDLLGHYGAVNKVIKAKVEEIMVPALERYDFSSYLVKLDSVLTEIINSTALVENKKLLENFKELMIEDERIKAIKVSELFGKWCNYVAAEVETSGLEVNCEDGEPSYENVEVTMTVEHEEGRAWSDLKKANIIFECEHDEKMNVLIPIHNWEKYDGNGWDIELKIDPDINNLRYLNSFEILLLKLKRGFCKIVLDEEEMEEEVSPEAEPEADWS